MSEIIMPQTSYLFYNVNLVPVKLRFIPVLSCQTRDLSTQPFIRELFEETIFTLSVEDLIMLSGATARVTLLGSKY
jgi:hypothetical protein